MKRRMIILFILTLCCLYFALITGSLVDKLNPLPLFFRAKNAWVFWCWLPIPIASIILGFKYKKRGLKCRKNIIGGFIVAFLLLAYGSFCLPYVIGQDYSRIDPYRSVVDADLPDHGEIRIVEFGTYFDNDKWDYVVVNVYYGREDVRDLEQSVTSGSRWIPCAAFRSELKALMPSMLRSDEDAYFSVYNSTTGEYNALPSDSGIYEIYAMRYDMSEKLLEIHRYLMEFTV